MTIKYQNANLTAANLAVAGLCASNLVERPNFHEQQALGQSEHKITENFQPRFAVASKRAGEAELCLVEHFQDKERADIFLAQCAHASPLFVVPAMVWLARNGNVRMWKSNCQQGGREMTKQESVLVSELGKAEIIIHAMLNAMTLKQKIKVSAQLEASCVSPDGMTRANERRAVLAAFGE